MMTQSMILVGKMFELLTYYTGVRDHLIHNKPYVSKTCVALISCGQWWGQEFLFRKAKLQH